MENESNIEIPISSEKDRFAQHLEAVNNQRIIFSGKFGSGKTYFLEKFFEEHEKYEPFFISPVHYSVSLNEDVFEYIKYDILINLLLKKDIEWDKTDIPQNLIAQFFLINNFWTISKDILSFLSKVGKLTGTIQEVSVADTVISRLSKLKTKYDSFKNEVNSNDKYTSIKFMKELAEKTGSIFEYNDITALINTVLNSMEEKKKVLIIDDLDRMDPEHIFRILNIFAAQFDSERFGYNKFEFDKVIIVCDLDNIRNLFAHKYGQGLDFSGYIDKFYSIEPFKFDNRKALVESTGNFILSTKNMMYRNYLLDINPLIELLVKYNIITTRKLVAKKDGSWSLSNNNKNYSNRFYPEKTLIFIDFILYLYGYIVEDLCNELEKLNDELNYTTYAASSFKFICPLLNLTDTQMENDVTVSLSNLNIKINLNISDPGYSDVKIKIASIQTFDGVDLIKVPFFKLLSICIQNYSKIKNNIQ